MHRCSQWIERVRSLTTNIIEHSVTRVTSVVRLRTCACPCSVRQGYGSPARSNSFSEARTAAVGLADLLERYGGVLQPRGHPEVPGVRPDDRLDVSESSARAITVIALESDFWVTV